MSDETELIRHEPQQQGQLSVADMTGQVHQIQELMRALMKDGEHYGQIPGTTSKKTLLKPGAEKLCLMFRFAPEYAITRRDLAGGHVEYEIACRLTHIPSGNFVGSGVGICSTMESKYRYRGGARVCPECGKATIKKSKFPPRNAPKAEPGFYCFQKAGGCGKEFSANDPAIVGQSEERQENPDISDSLNTVLKMAKKRALVDAVITATAASDIFTQDIGDPEEEPPVREHVPPRRQEQAKPAAPAQPAAPPREETEKFSQLRTILKEMGATERQEADAFCRKAAGVSYGACFYDDAAADAVLAGLANKADGRSLAEHGAAWRAGND